MTHRPAVPVVRGSAEIPSSTCHDEAREEGWKAGLSFMEKWRHGEAGQSGRTLDCRKAHPGELGASQRAL
ncbi:MAG: hypothetical protein ACLSTO_09570 [Bilophila wadsworthia]